jgi:primary-amine oxidase
VQNKFHEAIVNLTRQEIERNVRLGANIHAPADVAEITAMEKIALGDEGVKETIKQLQLPEGSVVISDPWIYGKRWSTLNNRELSHKQIRQDRTG